MAKYAVVVDRQVVAENLCPEDAFDLEWKSRERMGGSDRPEIRARTRVVRMDVLRRERGE
jgi:hypothetical protein